MKPLTALLRLSWPVLLVLMGLACGKDPATHGNEGDQDTTVGTDEYSGDSDPGGDLDTGDMDVQGDDDPQGDNDLKPIPQCTLNEWGQVSSGGISASEHFTLQGTFSPPPVGSHSQNLDYVFHQGIFIH